MSSPRTARLWSVGRPKAGVGHVGKNREIGGRDLRQSIDGLSSVRRPEQAVPAIIKKRPFLEIIRPIGDVDRITRLATGFNRVLVDRRIDHSQIVQDLRSLRTFASPKEAGDGNGRQQGDDGHDDHNLD